MLGLSGLLYKEVPNARNNQLGAGMIDYIRTFTSEKNLEIPTVIRLTDAIDTTEDCGQFQYILYVLIVV